MRTKWRPCGNYTVTVFSFRNATLQSHERKNTLLTEISTLTNLQYFYIDTDGKIMHSTERKIIHIALRVILHYCTTSVTNFPLVAWENYIEVNVKK